MSDALRRDDPAWVPTTLSDGSTITSMIIGGDVVMVPDGRGGMQPIPDDWEEQNGWTEERNEHG